jgi:hypothetical protein
VLTVLYSLIASLLRRNLVGSPWPPPSPPGASVGRSWRSKRGSCVERHSAAGPRGRRRHVKRAMWRPTVQPASQRRVGRHARARVGLGRLVYLQYVQLCLIVLDLNQTSDPEVQDIFSWPCDASGIFSASSTYSRLCEGGIRFAAADGIWKPWAPSKCKIFTWLAVQYRVWTTERRARHGLQAVASACFTCLQDVDSLDHILLHCSYAKEVWFLSMSQANLPDVTPANEDKLEEWWMRSRARVRSRERKTFDARVMLTCWSLWKQRNARAFANATLQCSAMELVRRIQEELAQWAVARFGPAVGGSYTLLGE